MHSNHSSSLCLLLILLLLFSFSNEKKKHVHGIAVSVHADVGGGERRCGRQQPRPEDFAQFLRARRPRRRRDPAHLPPGRCRR